MIGVGQVFYSTLGLLLRTTPCLVANGIAKAEFYALLHIASQATKPEFVKKTSIEEGSDRPTNRPIASTIASSGHRFHQVHVQFHSFELLS